MRSKRPPRRTSSKPSSTQQAKLFWTGRSQAVRLPKEFRFDGDTVLIRRDGNKVILEPDTGWPEGYLEWLFSGEHHLGDFELPSREGPGRLRDPFQVPIGGGRTANVFDILAKRSRKRKRRAK